jgi:hypothetical protein
MKLVIHNLQQKTMCTGITSNTNSSGQMILTRIPLLNYLQFIHESSSILMIFLQSIKEALNSKDKKSFALFLIQCKSVILIPYMIVLPFGQPQTPRLADIFFPTLNPPC